jgi:hypothetical protein
MSETCRTCGALLAADQRYCLECGARHGAPRLDWKAMTMRSAPGGPGLPGAIGGAGPRLQAGGAGLPSPRVAAALVLGVLAFGTVVGRAAGPGATTADAGAQRRNLTILAAAPATAAAVLPAPATTTPQPPAIDPGGLGDTSAGTSPGSSDTSSPAVTSPPADTSSPAPSPSSGGTGDAGSTTTPDSGTTDTTTATPAATLPPVKHVWVVALTGHSSTETFGPASPAPYLAGELRAKGALLPWYHAAGHDPSAGGVALLGGQKDAVGPFGAADKTLADQLTDAGRSWKAYVEGAADGLAPGANPCTRPPDQQPRNPFLRFGSITGASECGSLIGTPDQLAADAADTDSAPTFSYILPGPAHDGSTSLADADAWLKATLDPLLASKAYADGGLVVVTFDAGAPDDAEAGGGRVGALLLSPFVTPGATIETPHDPFSLLASIEKLFGLEPLGYAKDTTLKPFGRKVFGAWSPAAGGGS